MADVAQLVEPLIVVQVVVGSSPIVRPRNKKVLRLSRTFLLLRVSRQVRGN